MEYFTLYIIENPLSIQYTVDNCIFYIIYFIIENCLLFFVYYKTEYITLYIRNFSKYKIYTICN